MTLIQLAYCRSSCSKFPPLVYTLALSNRQLRYQLYYVEGRAKCQTVPQHCKLVTGTLAAGQGSK